MDTKSQCAAQGLQFSPLLIDATGGGWHPDVSSLLAILAKRQRANGQLTGGAEALAQRLSVTLQRSLARAALRRAVATLDAFQ